MLKSGSCWMFTIKEGIADQNYINTLLSFLSIYNECSVNKFLVYSIFLFNKMDIQKNGSSHKCVQKFRHG